MTSNQQICIEKLKGRDNFDVWKIAAESYLVIKGLWSFTQTEPATDAEASTITQDLKAKSEIVLLLDPQNYSFIANAKTAKQAWDALTNAFEDSGLCRRVSLLKELVQLKLEDCDCMEAYVNRMVMTSIKVSKSGLNISDEIIASLLLAGLPDAYKPLVMAVENSTKTLTTDKIKTLLLQEVKFDMSDSKNVMLAKTDKTRFKCHRCKQPGHFSKNCPRKSGFKKQNVLFTSFLANLSSNSAWYIDSGASAHMSNSNLMMENIRKPVYHEVVVANKEKLKIECVGDIRLKIRHHNLQSDIVLKDVHYVPGLCANLISVSQIIRNGNRVSFNNDKCNIYNKSNEFIASASLIGDMYRLNCATTSNAQANKQINQLECAITDTIEINKQTAEAVCCENEQTNLWHRRLGHICSENLRSVEKTVTGMKLFGNKNNNKCITCVKGKQTRLPFKDVGTRAESLLDLIHSDVCGPLQQLSIGGAKYFVTFVDDFSRKVFVYPIKSKGQVFETFVKFKAFVETQCARKIKIMRTDNGKEFCNKSFENFFAKHGIMHQKTAPYTPEQNGVAERLNRTLIERVRCMLVDSNLSINFWAEALSTAAYLLNRIPRRNQAKVPEELWSEKKPDISMLRVFGCKALAHVPKEKRRKLDVKSTVCIMLGYSSDSKAYRLYNPSTKKIITSRDVIFFENEVVHNKNFTKSHNSFLPTGVSSQRNDSLIYFETSKEPEITDENKRVSANNEVIEEDFTGEENAIAEIVENEEYDSADEQIEAEESILEISDDLNDTHEDSPNDPTYVPDVHVEVPQNLRHSERINQRYNLSVTTVSRHDPENVAQALSSPDANEWLQSMQAEMKSLEVNNTWNLVDLPKNKKPIKSKWVFKTKRNAYGEIVRFKARLVVKGFTQKHGIDYFETFSPVVKYTSIRLLLAIAVKNNLNIRQMDAVTAFLNGDLQEEIYMCQPEGFENGTKQVCKLNKSLYGLKQSSRVWNQKLNQVLLKFGLKRSNADQCIYFMVRDNKMLFVAIYVDDVLIFSNDGNLETNLKNDLCNNFEMKDMGDVSSILGIRITRDRVHGTLSIDQSQYIEDVLKRYKMSDCNPISTPLDPNQKISAMMSPKSEEEKEQMLDTPYMQAIGSLLFISQITRPDICFAVNVLSRYCNNPGKAHWTAVKRVMRYLKGTIEKRLVYNKMPCEIKGYCDADWGSEIDQSKSTSGYVFIMQGAAVSWASKRQPTVALSTTEAEFMSMVYAIQESIWLKRLEIELLQSSSQEMLIYCDNKSAIQLGKTNSTSARTKHIAIKAHFIQEKIENGQLRVEYIPTNEMPADILTKAVTRIKQSTFTKALGII